MTPQMTESNQDWRTARYYCPATLKHAHGTSQCLRPDGHDDDQHPTECECDTCEHSTECDTCEGYGEYATLTWAGVGETVIWPSRDA